MWETYARWIARLKWPIVIFWFAVALGITQFLPNLGTVVAHTSTNYLPAQSQTVKGQALLSQVNPKQYAKSTGVIVFHNGNGISFQDQQYIEKILSDINAHRAHYGIRYVDDLHNAASALSSTFISSRHTTEIAAVGFRQSEVSTATATAISRLKTALNHPPAGSRVYLTGEAPIQHDDIQLSQAGVKKTAAVAITLVLVVLLLVFRSVVAPFMVLASILLSYLISAGLVALFAEHGLPVSSFTQMFLIAILFGAGTDYSIIMMNRFREELARPGGDKEHMAVASTYKAVSKTVLFSASTVLVSFAALGLAKFGLYRSAVGVSVGMAVVLLTSLIFLPALMSLLGPWTFWPTRAAARGHQPSKFWATSSHVAVHRPWLTVLALLVVLLPVAMLFTNQRSFSPLDDIPSSPSAAGFRIASQSFGPGSMLPSQVVLNTRQNLRTPQGLTTIENISKALTGIGMVLDVQSATRPEGLPLKALEVTSQNQTAAGDLQAVSRGLDQVQDRLSAYRQRGSSQALTHAMEQSTVDLNQLSTGLDSLSGGIYSVQTGVAQVGTGLAQADSSLSTLSSAATDASQSTTQLSEASDKLAGALAAWAKAHPDTQGSAGWAQITSLTQSVRSGLKGDARATGQMAQSVGPVVPGLSRLQESAESLSHGSAQLSGDAGRLQTAAQSLAKTSQAMSAGGSLSADTSQHALSLASQGLQKVAGGVNGVSSYLLGSASANVTGNPGFYVPPSALGSPSMQRAMNAYISPNGHVAKFNVILNLNPYSARALNQISSLSVAAQVALASSPVHTGTVYTAGTTSTQAALNQISSQDFTRTVMLVLLAIFILLALLLSSIIAPAYIILSLAGMYFVTSGILQVIALHILHQPGVTWSVPFFVFLLLIALGVDYSIFLMSRFNEELGYGAEPHEAIQSAMANMGGVVFSAALIMAVTFGSMLVTGISSLMELAIAVMVGLLLYVVLFLGLFVPACVAIFGQGNFWPFAAHNTAASTKS